MKGINEGTMIMPNSEEALVRTNYYLLSRGKKYRIVYIQVSGNKKQPVIMTNLGLLDKLIYRIQFGGRAEKVSVYC